VVTRRYLLDTNTLSEPLKPEPNREALRRLREKEASIVLAAPVWHELVYGAALLPPSRKRKAIEHYLTEVVRPTFPILPYGEAAAEWHARERARLEKLGQKPPFVDGQIAAIAKSNDLVMVTANRKDFERFEGLELEDWTAAGRGGDGVPRNGN
jgi:tRNA(fMet)-specific endonuclease VapC